MALNSGLSGMGKLLVPVRANLWWFGMAKTRFEKTGQIIYKSRNLKCCNIWIHLTHVFAWRWRTETNPESPVSFGHMFGIQILGIHHPMVKHSPSWMISVVFNGFMGWFFPTQMYIHQTHTEPSASFGGSTTTWRRHRNYDQSTTTFTRTIITIVTSKFSGSWKKHVNSQTESLELCQNKFTSRSIVFRLSLMKKIRTKKNNLLIIMFPNKVWHS